MNSELQLNKQNKTVPISQTAGTALQRKCACGNHTIAGGECDECGKKHLSPQRAPRNSSLGTRNSERETGNSADVPPLVHEVLRSSGQPLDAATRAFFEPRFGHDFSRVRVHADAKAAESARAVNALAYTVGSSAVFRDGQYALETGEGKKLLAHELAHVLQQGQAGANMQTQLQVGSPQDAAESEADNFADIRRGCSYQTGRPSGRRPTAPDVAPVPLDQALSGRP